MTKSPKTHDIDIRILVVDALLRHGVPRDAIRHEITLDSSSSDGRADIVVALNERITGIEIKSDVDTLDRLKTQRDQYSRRFDNICLVVGEKHYPESAGYGLSCELGFGSVAVVRRDETTDQFKLIPETYSNYLPWRSPTAWDMQRGATRNQSSFSMLSMLWAVEVQWLAAELARDNSLVFGVPKTRCGAIPHLAEHTSIFKLRPLIAKALRERRLNRWEQAFWKKYDALVSA